uniref:Uncharacterized protein n=1 Tax=Alexandrium catenella TaxID=2925 RepID=A0A7S1QRI5_ALECA|mmetsp:Transcript_37203/g.100697  ORF Transcript_37203/g.100697 Transcript_37203/m.100697 type:complete len:163 (+) Transcript_37203:55-543(+)
MSPDDDATAGIQLAGGASASTSGESPPGEDAAGNAAAAERPAPHVAPLTVPIEVDVGSKACPHRAQLAGGVGRAVFGAIAGLGYRVVDNMSFVGEVIVDWLELDKPRYYHEMKELQKKRKKEEKRKKQQEAAAIASIEEADAGQSSAPRPTAPSGGEGARGG